MNRRLRVASVLALPALFFLAAPSHAQSLCSVAATDAPVGDIPAVTVCANGRIFNIPGMIVSGKQGLLPTTTVDLGGGASFYVGANFDADPFSIFTFGSILPSTFGALTLTATFNTPVLGGPYNFAHSYYTANLALSSAAGGGPSSATISNGMFPTYLSGFTNLSSLGVDVGSGACSIVVASSVSCPSGDMTNMLAPVSPSLLTARLSYTHTTTGTGASSSVGFVGGVEISSATTLAPEPTSVAMISVGLLFLGSRGATEKENLLNE